MDNVDAMNTVDTRGTEDADIRALVTMAQAYFDAAHEMDADQFASLFHPSSSVSAATRGGEGISVSVTPIDHERPRCVIGNRPV